MKKPITIYVSNKATISKWNRAELIKTAKGIASGLNKIRQASLVNQKKT
jgi:hypothetical protein